MLKRDYGEYPSSRERPAAFGRLCVETAWLSMKTVLLVQPPSGGCVLKPIATQHHDIAHVQPPSGGCVLKRSVLAVSAITIAAPAAFGRLCVETSKTLYSLPLPAPAAFGRLCVETLPPYLMSK